MEGRLQGPINPCFLEEEEEKDIEEHLDVEMEWLEQETSNNITKLGFGSPSERSFVEMRIPFLEMLQSGDSPALSPFCELSFQALLSLQQFKKPPCEESHSHHHHHQYPPELRECGGGSRFKEQQDSCLTHDAVEVQISPVKSETMDHHNTRSAIYVEGGGGNQHDASKAVELEERPVEAAAGKGPQKRKRVKRTRASAKNKEEVESQRMTHIAVERNRRRQMNDHLTALRSLMPSSYIQRGDQASIVGGAIDYVKELEQLHQSLQAQKRMKKSDLLDQSGGRSGSSSEITTSTSTSSSSTATTGILATSSPQTSQFGNTRFEMGELGNGTTTRTTTTEGINIRRSYEFTAVKKSGGVEVHVTVIQNHVSLKVECPRKAGVLLNAIVALEDLGLTVLHLNIMALENSAHYSFNLKIEEGCEIGSADGIAVVVHQIFCFIHRTT